MVPGAGWRALWRRLFSRRQMDADIEEEIEFHLQGRTDALVEGGLPEEEAARRARAELGDVNRTRSEWRLPEFGVRVALGADPGRLLRGTLGIGIAPVGAGLMVGTLGALLATRLLRTGLYGVSATDPVTFLAALVVLGISGLAASFGPARRASRVDPVEILNRE